MNKPKYHHWIAIVLIAALCSLFASASAQTPVSSGPVIISIQGDLWAWNGTDQPLIQLTDWGMNGSPILSPDGTRIAYNSTASIFVDWLRTVGGAGGFLPPENIWILDLPTQQTYRVAGQPADAAWNGPAEPGKYTMRQGLSWSPDGQQLAWIDIRVEPGAFAAGQHTNTVDIVVYDLASNTPRVVDTFAVTGGSPSAGVDRFNLSWGAPGVLLEMRPDEQTSATQYRLYDPAAGLIDEFAAEGLAGSDWVHYQDQDYQLLDGLGGGQWLNWRTGEIEPVPGRLEMVSLTAPDGARFVASDESWTLVLSDQAPVDLGDQVRPYGISRDGTAALYGRYEIDPATGFYAYTLIAHSSGGSVEIGRYENLRAVWGPVGLYVESAAVNE